MKNSLNRFVPDGYKPFVGSDEYKNRNVDLLKKKDVERFYGVKRRIRPF